MKEILIAIDFSKTGQKALEAGVRLARDLDARVTLLHVLDRHRHAQVYEGSATQRIFEEAAAQADAADILELNEKWADQAREWGLRVDTMAVPGPPVDAIIQTARDIEAGMIVVGSRGHSGLKKFVLGSVAEGVVQRAQRPVLVVPAN